MPRTTAPARLFALTAIFFTLITTSSCGYHLRGNTREFFDSHQIKTIYVAPVANNSYKAGVEITVYNAMRKRFAEGGYVRIVDAPNDADAQISAAVQDAGYTPAANTRAKDLTPKDQGPPDVLIASIYEARLRVRFELKDHRDRGLWADELTRTKRFSSSTYFGAVGNTSALINESEFDRSLGDLSVSIVTDAEESINTLY